MLWLGVEGEHKEGLWTLAHKGSQAEVVLFSDQKDLGLRFSISKDKGYRDCRKDSSLEPCPFWYLAAMGRIIHCTTK